MNCASSNSPWEVGNGVFHLAKLELRTAILIGTDRISLWELSQHAIPYHSTAQFFLCDHAAVVHFQSPFPMFTFSLSQPFVSQGFRRWRHGSAVLRESQFPSAASDRNPDALTNKILKLLMQAASSSLRWRDRERFRMTDNERQTRGISVRHANLQGDCHKRSSKLIGMK